MTTEQQKNISRQRDTLTVMLKEPLRELARQCSKVFPDRKLLDQLLKAALVDLPYIKFIYVMNTHAIQISDNVSHDGILTEHFGRDRSVRPYIQTLPADADFFLSDAYISLRAKRPSITAIQAIHYEETGTLLGYIGVDADTRDLPLARELVDEPQTWHQIKGDPAIRAGLFAQHREESLIDKHSEEVIAIMEELIVDHGIFHGKIHFSNSRSTIWLVDDPYRYRLLDFEAMTDPDIVLTYPRREYPEDAVVPADMIRPLLELFRKLRIMDDVLYLRSGSINIFNGMIGLTFSCDGTHYLPYDEFIRKGIDFWLGSQSRTASETESTG